MRFARFASVPLLATALLTLGCHAQQPASAGSATAAMTAPAGTPLSPELQRRVEVMLRQKANLPPETVVHVGGLTPSEFPGYDDLTVTVVNEGRVSRPITFLLSKDNKTLAQISKFDISVDPKTLIPAGGRPARGGPENAPVTVVNFDDLECPYCARFHETIFPALTQRYGDKVRVVYKDFPLTEIHPWAMRASIDTNCLAEQSPTAYWSAVDYIHAHTSEIGTDPKDPKAEKTLDRASTQLDDITRQQGASQKLDATKLNACLSKQDATAVNASREAGNRLGINSTPTFFVNGEKLDGAVSLPFLFGQIDQALRVAGVQPPPPYTEPTTPQPANGARTPSAHPSGS